MEEEQGEGEREKEWWGRRCRAIIETNIINIFIVIVFGIAIIIIVAIIVSSSFVSQLQSPGHLVSKILLCGL